MTSPPPTPKLFPYTTLFRSDRERRRAPELPGDAVFRLRLRASRQVHGPDGQGHLFPPVRGLRDPRERLGRVLRQDRKSTRLNSSHSSISYAVFCLQKKIHEP